MTMPLPNSEDAMEWISHFKYVNGCCIVERSWVGAMEIIGKGEEFMMTVAVLAIMAISWGDEQ